MSLQPESLVLRDIHPPVAPPWWPPAPGWWIVAGIVLLLAAMATWLALRRRRQRSAIEALFDATMVAAATPSARVAAMSELLRRASRRHDRDADRLHGDAWLQFLEDGAQPPLFVQEQGRLLLEGGFRRDIDSDDADALQRQVRRRFLELMQRPRRRHSPALRWADGKPTP